MKSFIEENDLAWIELKQYTISGTVKTISSDGIIIQTAPNETEAVAPDSILRMYSKPGELIGAITSLEDLYGETFDIDGFISSDINNIISIGHSLTKNPRHPETIPPAWNDNIGLWFHSSGGKCPCGCEGGFSSSETSLQKPT